MVLVLKGIGQWFSTGDDLAPPTWERHWLVMSGDVFDCRDWKRRRQNTGI